MTTLTVSARAAPFLVLAAAVLWSTGGLGIKWLKSDAGLSAMAISGWRSVAALLGLLAFLGTGALAVRPTVGRLAAAVAYAATLLTLVSATTLTTAAGAILLQYTAPVWLTAMNLLLPGGDRVSKRDTGVCAVSMLALGLLIADVGADTGVDAGGDTAAEIGAVTAPDAPAVGSGSLSLWGNLLGVASGAAFATLTRLLRAESAAVDAGGDDRRAADGRADPHTTALWVVMLGNALLAVCCLPWMIASAPSLAPDHVGVLAGLGVLQIALPYVLFTRAIALIPAVRATLIGMLEPILNGVLVWALLAERPGPLGLLGGGLLIATLTVDAAWPHRAEKADLPTSASREP